MDELPKTPVTGFHRRESRARVLAPASKLDQPDYLRLARLPANCGAGQDVEVHAEGGGAVEAQPTIDLEEVEVGANVDRPGRGIRHSHV